MRTFVCLLLSATAALAHPHHGPPPNMICADGTRATCLCPGTTESCFDADSPADFYTDIPEDHPWPNCSPRTFAYTCDDGSEPVHTALLVCADKSNITCTCTTEGKEDCTEFLPKRLVKVCDDDHHRRRGDDDHHHRGPPHGDHDHRGPPRDDHRDEHERRGPPPCKFHEMELSCDDGAEPALTIRPAFLPVKCQAAKCEFDFGLPEWNEEEDEEEPIIADCKCRDSGVACYSNDGDDLPACQPTQWILTCPNEDLKPRLPFFKRSHHKRHHKRGGRKHHGPRHH